MNDAKRVLNLISVLSVILISGACNPRQQVHEMVTVRDPSPPASLASQDREFIEHAAEGNNAEVAIGTLVHGRALAPAVIEYGEMMIRDHRAANLMLAGVAKEHRIMLPSSLGEHQAGFDRLVDKKRHEFDEEFIRVMIEDHQKAVRLYESELSSGLDPLLKQYAATMLPKIQAHLAHAKSFSAPTNRP